RYSLPIFVALHFPLGVFHRSSSPYLCGTPFSSWCLSPVFLSLSLTCSHSVCNAHTLVPMHLPLCAWLYWGSQFSQPNYSITRLSVATHTHTHTHSLSLTHTHKRNSTSSALSQS